MSLFAKMNLTSECPICALRPLALAGFLIRSDAGLVALFMFGVKGKRPLEALCGPHRELVAECEAFMAEADARKRGES